MRSLRGLPKKEHPALWPGDVPYDDKDADEFDEDIPRDWL